LIYERRALEDAPKLPWMKTFSSLNHSSTIVGAALCGRPASPSHPEFKPAAATEGRPYNG